MSFFDDINPIKAIGGLLGGSIDKSTPSFNPVDFSQKTKEMMGQYRTDSNKSAEDLTKQQLQGTEEGRQFLKTPDQIQRQAIAMGSNPSQYQAIANRSNRQLESDLNKLQRNVEFNAQSMKIDRLKAQNAIDQDEYKIKSSLAMQRIQSEINKRNTRNQVIGGLFGAIGGIGGAVLGASMGAAGGPLGMIAGAKLGGDIGSNAGQLAGGGSTGTKEI